MTKQLSEKIALLMGVLFAAGLIIFLNAVLVAFLWNWLMPAIFGLKTITYLQAVGITWLAQILFKANLSTKKD
jgi:hypothetical protein